MAMIHDCGGEKDHANSSRGIADLKAEAARELANKHYQVEAGLKQILRFTDRADAEVVRAEPIKLLEVNENTAPSGVMPLHFGPAPESGILYPSVIVEVTPGEFERIQSKELKLPDGWEDWEELPRPAERPGGA